MQIYRLREACSFYILTKAGILIFKDLVFGPKYSVIQNDIDIKREVLIDESI